MRKALILGASLFLLMFVFGSALATEGPRTGPTKLVNKLISGDEELPNVQVVTGGIGASREGVPIQVGDTYYDYQHNGSMGRQIVYTFESSTTYNGIHIDWMCLPCVGGSRHIRYNARDVSTGTWAWTTGPNGGKVSSLENGGYCSIDAGPGGVGILGFHSGVDPDQYRAQISYDENPPLGYWEEGSNPGPADYTPDYNCEGIITGAYEANSQYIWPIIEWDDVAGDTIVHKLCTESPPTGAPAGEIQSLIYYRDQYTGGAVAVPTCGTFIDSVFDIAGVVRQDPTSDEVAIVYAKPIHYDGDPNDPCGNTQWQNDVAVWYSYDGGVSFTVYDNITDYTNGGTVPVDQCDHLLYTDLSAVYDHDGVLHIVWSTPIWDGCDPQFASRMWHWDDLNDCIALVYDASRPRYFYDPGAWNNSTCKMSVSECHVDGTTRLYCQFTRFGAHTSVDGDTSVDASAGGYENGDILLVGSSDGGLTWSEAVNLTDTQTDDCDPGDCLSEHWSTMAKYSNDSVYIEYIEDHDAGGLPQDEGSQTCNPLMYLSHPCFSISSFCDAAYSPVEVAYPMHIAPDDGSTDCTSSTDTTFTLTIINTGNQATTYSVASDQSWLTPANASGPLGVGCDNQVQVTYTIGPIASEGVYSATLTVSACEGGVSAVINVTVYVFCYFYEPEYELLSTACWSIGVWNTARAGTAQWNDPEGNMFWYPAQIPPDGAAFMYDESVVITYADDTTMTYFSLFDGSDDDVSLRAQSYLTTATFSTYEYGHALWSSGDTAVVGEIEYYLPTHPDTCVLIQRIKVCNDRDTTIRIHVGEAIDWDIPDSDGGSDNECDADAAQQIVWQIGTDQAPETSYYGTVQFCSAIPGAIVLDNQDWVYPNSGYEPDELGGLMKSHSGFSASCSDSLQDRNSVYVVDRNVVLEPDSCRVYCKVKTSSIVSLADLYTNLVKGRKWIAENGLDCPGRCCCCIKVGDADGSGALDIDDVVYLIQHIFSGGPAPVPCEVSSGDADSSYGVDIDDVVYLINHIFLGGPPPDECEDWIATCGY